jgi:alpha-beta hydrolase superfamily lysophospholipase
MPSNDLSSVYGSIFRNQKDLSKKDLYVTMNEQQHIIREEFFLTSDPGIQIFVREVRDGGTQHMQKGPVLLLHGARVPGIASFDLDVPNGSLAADLASNGHVVYIMDARSYGKSSRPPEMEQPPLENPPLEEKTQWRDPAVVQAYPLLWVLISGEAGGVPPLRK